MAAVTVPLGGIILKARAFTIVILALPVLAGITGVRVVI